MTEVLQGKYGSAEVSIDWFQQVAAGTQKLSLSFPLGGVLNELSLCGLISSAGQGDQSNLLQFWSLGDCHPHTRLKSRH